MDSVLTVTPAPPRRASPPRLSPWGWAVVALALLGYGLLIAKHVGAYAGGSDSSGYMNHARLLGTGHVHVAPRTVAALPQADTPEWLYSALGFKPAPDGNGLVPTYATGLPLWVLAAAQVVGWAQAGNLVLWLHAMAGVLITYAAGRTFRLSGWAAVTAAVIIGGSPVYLFIGLQGMSDVPALVWTTAAVVAAWRSRSRSRWALAAGAAYGMAVLIRPTDALALAPIALVLTWFGRTATEGEPTTTSGYSALTEQRPPASRLARVFRRWIMFGLGGLPFAVFFALHSRAAYGAFLTTGYGDSAGLDASWVAVTCRHYAHWLPIVFTPVVLAFVGVPLLLRRLPLHVVALVTWVLVFAGFYSAYYCTHETWWYLRFLLPAAPALVIGSVLVLQELVVAALPRWVAALAACAVLIGIVKFQTRWVEDLTALDSGAGEEVYPQTAAWMRQHLPKDAVVACMQTSGALYYYTDFTFVRWDMLDPKSFAKLTAALVASGRPLYASFFPYELEERHALTEYVPGNWEQIGSLRQVTFWRWSPAPKK